MWVFSLVKCAPAGPITRTLLQIVNQKINVGSAKSKVGSLDNVGHKAGGGDKKVFNDVEYLRQTSGGSKNGSRRQSAVQVSVLEFELSVLSCPLVQFSAWCVPYMGKGPIRVFM